MRYLVLADIHSNLEALQSVLQYTDYHQVLMLGDVVGYGASPEETVRRVQQLAPVASVRGNHDKVAGGLETGDSFAPHALQAALWTRRRLSEESLHYVRGLPAGPVQVDATFSIAHGSPSNEDEYLFPDRSPAAPLKTMATPICFFGHTHIPTIFQAVGNTIYSIQVENQTRIALTPAPVRYLINPGSVGQPRDGDPHAAFLVFDTDTATVEFFRVDYDIAAAQEKIRQAGLPEILWRRLARGV